MRRPVLPHSNSPPRHLCFICSLNVLCSLKSLAFSLPCCLLSLSRLYFSTFPFIYVFILYDPVQMPHRLWASPILLTLPPKWLFTFILGIQRIVSVKVFPFHSIVSSPKAETIRFFICLHAQTLAVLMTTVVIVRTMVTVCSVFTLRHTPCQVLRVRFLGFTDSKRHTFKTFVSLTLRWKWRHWRFLSSC